MPAYNIGACLGLMISPQNGQALVGDSTQANGFNFAAPAPAAHASTHATGQADPLTAANIGAAAAAHAHVAADTTGTAVLTADSRLSDSRNPLAHGASLHTDITRSVFLMAEDASLNVGTFVNLGATPNLLRAVALADAATQGCFWSIAVPDPWASGVITAQPFWVPGATDAVAHTVRWTFTAKSVAAGGNITTAGTATTWTGASAARTVSLLVKDTATSTGVTPAAAGDLFMLGVQRIGADAADTYVGVCNLVGILLSYTANQ